MPLPDHLGYADLYEVAPTSAIDRSGVRPLNEWMQIVADFNAGIANDSLVTSGGITQTLAGWMQGQTQQTNFWSDVDQGLGTPFIYRFRERVFVGNAVLFPDARSSVIVNGPTNGTWIPDHAAGAAWAPRDSQLVVMAETGAAAITGMTKASLGESLGLATPPPPIGVAGYVINDTGQDQGSWAFYADVQHEPTAAVFSSLSVGMEVAAKNKGTNITGGPYAFGGGVIGVWLVGGGDNAYGGNAVNPSNIAIGIMKNAHTWNKGLVIGADAITGTDGVTGTGTAIALAKGHYITWQFAGANTGARIRSDVATVGQDVTMTFINNGMTFTGSNSKAVASFIAVASGVNGVSLAQGVAGQPARILSGGDDTDVDLHLVPKGTGNVRFGTLSATGDVAITGYITVKDSGGTARKLAVIT